MRAFIQRRIGTRRGAASWSMALAVPFAVLLASVLVFTASFAAFGDATETGESTFTSNQVFLGNDHSGRAMFTLPNLAPGDTGWQQTRVNFTSTVDAEVRVFVQLGEGDQTLAQHMRFLVRASGEGVSTVVWQGRLTELMEHTDFATGIIPMPRAAGSSHLFYVFEYWVDADAPYGAGTSLAFVWEARSDVASTPGALSASGGDA